MQIRRRVCLRPNPPPALLFCRNPQTLHLAIQVAALQAEHLCRAADVAMILVQLFENVVALICCPRLVQRGALATRNAAAAVAVHQWREMLAFETPRCC